MVDTPQPRQPANEIPGTELDLPSAWTTNDALTMLRWHLDRYDRLRASTASRAAVVLSASALLSAANAVIIAQVLGERFNSISGVLLALCVLPSLAGFVLIVLTVLRATGVLTTTRSSRTLLTGAAAPPPGPIFNGGDTLDAFVTYHDFSAAVDVQDRESIIQSAKAELWIVIHQHRLRYVELRTAVRLLRLAAVTLPIAIVVVVIVGLNSGG